MSRLRIEIPGEPVFCAMLPVRITDLNYGKHLANDKLIGMLHEARVQFFVHLGCKDDLDFFGVGLIQADVAVEYKSEAFYGQTIAVAIHIADKTPKSFTVYYRLSDHNDGRLIALARTSMVAFDYAERKVSRWPDRVPAVFQP
jgi:acyl-CoA thioester hydrolase